jgi:hypothetical protein
VTWRPPSARDQPDDRFDRRHEGVPSWLVQPLQGWVAEFFVLHPPMEFEAVYDAGVIREIEMAVRFDPPLPWPDARDAAEGILQRFDDDSPEAIDVLDFLLRRRPRHFSWQVWDDRAAELSNILDSGGSVWEVTTGEEGEDGARYQLTRRVAGPVVDAIEEVGSLSERAGQHLREAWTQLLGVDPDPSAAYQAAVAAVEVAAKPLVSPNQRLTTLGSIRGELAANPTRWTFELGDMQLVVGMVSALWDNQLRHGDEAAPPSETQEQADAAVHLAVTLVRWFSGGAIRLT